MGGRVFYEIYVYGENTLYFITRGFFDQEGYTQPGVPANTKGIIIGVSVSVVVVILLAGLCYYLKKRNDENERIKGSAGLEVAPDKVH